MYKIFADDTLIYDSTIEDYRIQKGNISLETNKAGSFVLSIPEEHFFYDNFIRLKTVITVFKSGKIKFRGRVLNDVTDYWNNKVLTCEGELRFLQDSIIRPFEFSGTPERLFKRILVEHNAQVDEFKQFKIGKVTVVDENDYIARSNTNYESALSNMNSRLLGSTSGGYLYITHGADGTDQVPTLNYLSDFTNISKQKIEFGVNLKDYTKSVSADSIATCIIPLGAEMERANREEKYRLNIAGVNQGHDYIYDEAAVALYGWITKVVIWDDVTIAENLLRKAEEYLRNIVKQNVTIELTAIDLHLLDNSMESFNVGDYIEVVSQPHNFNDTLLCNKQSLDILKPDNDSLVLGYTYSTFTETSSKVSSSISTITNIQSNVAKLNNKVTTMDESVTNASKDANEALNNVNRVSEEFGAVSKDFEIIAEAVAENTRNISANANNIATNAINISNNGAAIITLSEDIAENTKSIKDIYSKLSGVTGNDIVSTVTVSNIELEDINLFNVQDYVKGEK